MTVHILVVNWVNTQVVYRDNDLKMSKLQTSEILPILLFLNLVTFSWYVNFTWISQLLIINTITVIYLLIDTEGLSTV